MKNLKYYCKVCHKKYLKWQGSCPSCNEWNSIIEQSEDKKNVFNDFKLSSLASIELNDNDIRLVSGIKEWDNVLGGGIVKDSVILLTGMPGIGKSTLLLTIAEALSTNYSLLYISSEESASQIKMRALRLNIKNKEKITIVSESDYDKIIPIIESVKPDIVFLDSLQNLNSEEILLSNQIGKIKHIMHQLTQHAKENKYSLLCTCHMTKEGEIAGPKAIEHIVDVVLYCESDEESTLRIIRSTKNRFGDTQEVGFFMMGQEGMTECTDPQSVLVKNMHPSIGSSFALYSEGKRSFIIEIQTLINQTKMNIPQRIIQGVDQKQFVITSAVIEKYLKIPLSEFDIFCKISGNIKLKKFNCDCAIAAALLSSYFNAPLKEFIICDGELSLSGNLKSTLFSINALKKITDRYPCKKIIIGSQENNDLKDKKIFFEIKHIYNLLSFFK